MKKNFIQIKKVSKIYKNKFEALKNIDLNIQEVCGVKRKMIITS